MIILGFIVLSVMLFWRIKSHRNRRFRRTKTAIKADTSSRPFSNHPKPEWVRLKVIYLKAILGQKTGCRRVAQTFNRLYGDKETVGKTYVAKVIAKHQYELHAQRRTIKSKLPHQIAVNCTWAMDLSFYTTADKASQPFVGIIDHGSRKALTLQKLMNKSSWMLLGYLCLAIGKYGKPNKLRTDNEAIFTSFVFRTFLKLVNIQHQRILTASPWRNGRIERLFGTLKPMLREVEIENKTELQHWLNQFRYWYNHQRTHQNLNGKTPEDIWRRRR